MKNINFKVRKTYSIDKSNFLKKLNYGLKIQSK